MSNEIIEFVYNVPCQSEDDVEKHNKMMMEHFPDFKPLESTQEHCFKLAEKLIDSIYKVGDDGGWYLGDGIKVTVKIEYDPENK